MAHSPAHVPPDVIEEVDPQDLEGQKAVKTKDDTRTVPRPSSGRTTALGRRVEKPETREPAGPSGQKDGFRHEGKHANK